VNSDGLCEFNEDGSVKKNSMIPDNKPDIISVSSIGKFTVHAKPVTKPKTMPKSTTKTSMTVDRQQLEATDSFGFTGSRSKQYDSIVALARKAEDLQKQLAYQKEQVAYQKAQNAKLRAAATDETAPAPESDLIRAIPNAELIGSKKRGAAEERLRRTVEAIQEYNAGRELAEQIAVNKGSLRTLAGVNAQTINTWVDAKAAELAQYSEAQGHGYRQNVGQDLSVIKWSEAAYGAYEWPKEQP
jgi:hypothetical protein